MGHTGPEPGGVAALVAAAPVPPALAPAFAEEHLAAVGIRGLDGEEVEEPGLRVPRSHDSAFWVGPALDPAEVVALASITVRIGTCVVQILRRHIYSHPDRQLQLARRCALKVHLRPAARAGV